MKTLIENVPTQDVKIPIGDIKLEGEIRMPKKATGMVIFSHGSGSSRFSKRNRFVADVLYYNGIGSLLFDLLTEEEDTIYDNRFNIELLTARLIGVTEWAAAPDNYGHLNLAYFGASTGAASALNAAAELGEVIKTVVSRGGRPDLSMPILSHVKCPVLLLVGQRDEQVIELNKMAYNKLNGMKELEILPEATHLFEEPGALEEVARQSVLWFHKYV